MSIQWYPGHMHKAQKEIKKVISQVDLVIEVLDARIPFSSENPMIGKLIGDKPCIKVLTKSDLADPEATKTWLNHFDSQLNRKALTLSNSHPEHYSKIIDLIHKLLPGKTGGLKTINVMIMGIPNVGKSTIINVLAGKTIAKTGNEPAVTKGQQRINLRNGIMLWDTPGMLWPKVENENSSYRLATTGAIRSTAMSYDEVAFFAVEYLLKTYPQLLSQRFNLDSLPATELEFLETVGKMRGCIGARGRVNLDKVSKLVITELRSGAIGRITFESPELVAAEIIAVDKQIALREEKKRDRKKKFKQTRK